MRKLLEAPKYEHAPVHDYILQRLFALKVELRLWVEGDDGEPNPNGWYNSLSEDKSTIFVDTWWWSVPEGDYRYCRCCFDVNDIKEAFNIAGGYCNDGNGTINTQMGGVLLNDYGLDPHEDYENENGFCHVVAFATVSHTGVIRYSQVVYDFPQKRLVLFDDICYNMPMDSVHPKLFGMKRACYRNWANKSFSVAYDYKYIDFADDKDGFAVGCNPKNNPSSQVITI
jgi:hypothetical protein